MKLGPDWYNVDSEEAAKLRKDEMMEIVNEKTSQWNGQVQRCIDEYDGEEESKPFNVKLGHSTGQM